MTTEQTIPALENLRIADVLEWQIRLWRWWQTRDARIFAGAFPLVEVIAEAEGKEHAAEWCATANQMVLERADPWLVDEDVIDTVGANYDDMPPDPIIESDIPSSSAFVLLKKAVSLPDRHGKHLAMRAFSWTVGVEIAGGDPRSSSFDIRPVTAELASNRRRVLLMTIYGHLGDKDEYTKDIRAQRERLRVARGFQVIPDLNPIGIHPVPFDDDLLWREDMRRATPLHRWIVAFWRFVGQEITGRGRDYAPRSARRDAQRAGIDGDGYVTTIRLRRVHRSHEPSGESGRVLDHRHIVSGHWKRVWLPSLGVHRPTFIAAYVRGPDDAPLRIRRARGVIVDR